MGVQKGILTDPRAPADVKETDLLMAPLQGVIERVVPKGCVWMRWGIVGSLEMSTGEGRGARDKTAA